MSTGYYQFDSKSGRISGLQHSQGDLGEPKGYYYKVEFDKSNHITNVQLYHGDNPSGSPVKDWHDLNSVAAADGKEYPKVADRVMPSTGIPGQIDTSKPIKSDSSLPGNQTGKDETLQPAKSIADQQGPDGSWRDLNPHDEKRAFLTSPDGKYTVVRSDSGELDLYRTDRDSTGKTHQVLVAQYNGFDLNKTLSGGLKITNDGVVTSVNGKTTLLNDDGFNHVYLPEDKNHPKELVTLYHPPGQTPRMAKIIDNAQDGLQLMLDCFAKGKADSAPDVGDYLAPRVTDISGESNLKDTTNTTNQLFTDTKYHFTDLDKQLANLTDQQDKQDKDTFNKIVTDIRNLQDTLTGIDTLPNASSPSVYDYKYVKDGSELYQEVESLTASNDNNPDNNKSDEQTAKDYEAFFEKGHESENRAALNPAYEDSGGDHKGQLAIMNPDLYTLVLNKIHDTVTDVENKIKHASDSNGDTGQHIDKDSPEYKQGVADGQNGLKDRIAADEKTISDLKNQLKKQPSPNDATPANDNNPSNNNDGKPTGPDDKALPTVFGDTTNTGTGPGNSLLTSDTTPGQTPLDALQNASPITNSPTTQTAATTGQTGIDPSTLMMGLSSIYPAIQQGLSGKQTDAANSSKQNRLDQPGAGPNTPSADQAVQAQLASATMSPFTQTTTAQLPTGLPNAPGISPNPISSTQVDMKLTGHADQQVPQPVAQAVNSEMNNPNGSKAEGAYSGTPADRSTWVSYDPSQVNTQLHTGDVVTWDDGTSSLVVKDTGPDGHATYSYIFDQHTHKLDLNGDPNNPSNTDGHIANPNGHKLTGFFHPNGLDATQAATTLNPAPPGSAPTDPAAQQPNTPQPPDNTPQPDDPENKMANTTTSTQPPKKPTT